MHDLIAATSLGRSEVTALFLALAILLAAARALGELARRFRQPAVLGEILAGILLGKTVLGTLLPQWSAYLFPAQGPVAVATSGLTTVAIALFLLVAGLEVDLGAVWRRGRPALAVGVLGMIVPFVAGFCLAWFAPRLVGLHERNGALVAALFLGTALSISALPVIAKILLDLKLYRTDMGMVVIAAAILNDLAGWLIFALLLGMMAGQGDGHFTVGQTAAMTVGFVLFMLTIGRWVIDRAMPHLQARLSWPGGTIGAILAVAMVAAAFTEWIGIHAIFGTFILGVAVGDSRHLREQTRATLDQFISFFFAPLFFASFGLHVNFIANFDWRLVSIVLLVAMVGKVLGAGVGALWSGLDRRQSLAIGLGMNARGAMEIILGLLALQTGLIGERLFVALVIMALVTSFLSGTLMQRVLGERKPAHFADSLTGARFRKRLEASTARQAIEELVQIACKGAELDPGEVMPRVLYREHIASSGLANGVAAPHARVPGLKAPIIAVGISERGVDFGARDGKPARIVCLLLTGFDDAQTQLDLLAGVARTFDDPRVADKAADAATAVEFLAVVKSVGSGHGGAPAGA